MRILIVGGGKGSWVMRGVQLGAALGARVTTQPTSADWDWADRVVLVKRDGARHSVEAHRRGLPIIWDALDFWRQPAENGATTLAAMGLFTAQARALRPALTIGATRAMASDVGGAYLPHHAWAGLAPAPVREAVQVVAYEGQPSYLGAWRARIEGLCQARGWRFAINPPDLRGADVLVALRDGPWDGWLSRQWKSGVKLANAIAAGRPVITQDGAAWREMRPVGTAIETPADLTDACDAWTTPEARARALSQDRQAYAIETVAAQYRALLQTVGTPCTI